MEPNSAVTDFVKEKESAYQRVFSQLPRLTSLEAGWSGIHLVYDRLPPSVIPEVAAEQHGIAIYTEVSPSTQMEHRAEQHQQAQLKPSDIIITPARSRTRSQWDAPVEVIFLEFDAICTNG
ncbi:hypothetical protein [Leptolyngbya sp. NIES-2104]|uniref:hypothetical protein n=1 Tax=Leptolyngbya sp. NIES-2104 TaxID=1552121 RepID=UPI0006ECB903|nr:hypothetical protein [Leptolyngbya sp. NIES-2104]GAQ00005.1 hypothetical protein NIES2104_65700 [Leptolyngbya sp. NIES-2104]